MRSAYAVDVILPEDLAVLFGREEVEPAVAVRSSLPELVLEGVKNATIAITFLQGPPSVAYWVAVVRKWAGQKASPVELKMNGRNGSLQVTLSEHVSSDRVGEVAELMHRTLFEVETPDTPDPDSDDDDLAS